MHKKFLRILSLLVTLASVNAEAMEVPEEGIKAAPPIVRRATDEAKKSWGALRDTARANRILTPRTLKHKITGSTPNFWCNDEKNPRPVRTDEQYLYAGSGKQLYPTLAKNFIDSLDNLKATINSQVAQPVGYEGDLSLDLTWQMWTDGYYRLSKSIEEAVVSLANKLGGWEKNG